MNLLDFPKLQQMEVLKKFISTRIVKIHKNTYQKYGWHYFRISYNMNIFYRLLFCVLILPPLSVQSQEETSKQIILPETLQTFEKDTVIINKQHYYLLFHDSLTNYLPNIDFNHYKLIGKIECTQCLLVCPPLHKRCHRNRCYMSQAWYLEEKTP